MRPPKGLKQHLHNRLSRNKLWLILFWLLITVGIIGLTAEYAYTQTTITNDFGSPMDNPTGTIGYDLKNTSLSGATCFKDEQGNAIDWSNLYHAGEDWFGSEGTEVKTVADGEVVFTSNVNYPGNVVIVKHILSDNSIVYSMYGHLKNDSTVSLNQTVTKGNVIGHLIKQTIKDNNNNEVDNTHLHWEIRNFEDGGFICDNNYTPGPGYTYPNHPDSFPGRCERFYNPSDYVNAPQTGYCLVYLPIVHKNPVSTPTPVPCPHNQSLLSNGDFEDGYPPAPWQEVSVGGFPLVVQSSGSYRGNWHAFMGGYSYTNDRLYQSFLLPPGTTGATLDYYVQIGSQSNSLPSGHILKVHLRTNSNQHIVEVDKIDSAYDLGIWYHETINIKNLSAYAGQTLRLSIEAQTNSGILSAFHVDDVTLRVNCLISSNSINSPSIERSNRLGVPKIKMTPVIEKSDKWKNNQ